MQYKLILFDLDNTLLDYDQAERSALKNALTQFGVINNFARYHADYNRINKTFWQKFENKEISVEQLRVERFEELFLLNKLTIHAESFSNPLIGHFAPNHIGAESNLIVLLHGLFPALVGNFNGIRQRCIG